MCISLVFSYADSANDMANDALQRLAHSDVSCANSWIFVGRLVTGEIAVLSSHPITGSAAVAFPKSPKHALMPCTNAPCIDANIQGILRPSTFVVHDEPYDEAYDEPVYRSLGTSPPDIRLEPLQVVSNPDGGISAIVPVAPYVEADMSQEQRHALSQPMIDCVLNGLDTNGIPHERLFGRDYDPDVAPWELVHMLHSGSSPRCDVVLGMASDDSTAATFTFLHVAKANARTIPFLGHVHGGYKAPMGVIDEPWTLLTNDPTLLFTMPKDAPRADDDDEGYDVTIIPTSMEKYRITYARAEGIFQEHCAGDLFAKINAILRESMLDRDAAVLLAPGPLKIQSLQGYDIPRDTVELRLDRDWRVYNSPESVAQRITALKK